LTDRKPPGIVLRMAEPSLAQQIKSVLAAAEKTRDDAGRTPAGRQYAVAATHLRTALAIVRSNVAESEIGGLPATAKALPAVRKMLHDLAL
jgi:hypothetical protein